MSKMNTATALIVAAALVSAVLVPATRTPGARGAASTEPSQTSAAQSPPGQQGSDNDEDIDTFQMIGASLGVDVSTEGLRRRATRILAQLQEAARKEAPPPENVIPFFEALLRLPIRPHTEFAQAKKALEALALNPGNPEAVSAAAAAFDAFVTRYFDIYALTHENASKEDVLLAGDFDEIDKASLQLAILEDVVKQSGDAPRKIRFLIATLPDPIDSFTGWQFDPMLDAVTQAIAESDYVLDRFHFPDSDKEDTHPRAGERGRRHELEPGIVVFKKHVEADAFSAGNGEKQAKAPFGDRLVLLIVHENPAAGVHVRALANAIRVVIRSRHLIGDDEFERGIAILGPTFSGSSETINRALVMASARAAAECMHTQARKCRVRIVSGSATDRQNKRTIEYHLGRNAVGGESDSRRLLDVMFQATVNPDDVLLPQLVATIDEVKWSRRTAVLYEANTQYGRQLWESLSGHAQATRGPDSSRFVQLPFPMNVSRLRTTLESQDAGRPVAFGLPSRFRPVPMENDGNPLDQIPQFNAKTAATYMELALAGMLDTLHREDVKTVGLMATDPRDKLFLAQQIARYSPNVSLFTAESDSVYVHPDYSPYLRGALVASSYPLYGANQRWSYGYQGDTERRQFANGSAQGIYNAVLALLEYEEDGSPRRGKETPRLLEYGMPGQSCTLCTPPIWISVIGRLGAWPVRAYLPKTSQGQEAYLFAVNVRRETSAGPSLTILPTPLFKALLIFLTSAILGSWAIQRTATIDGSQSWLRIDGPRPDRRVYLLAALAGVLLIQAFIWGLCLLRFFRAEKSGWSTATLAAASLGLLAGCHMVVRVLAVVVRTDGNTMRTVIKGRVFALAAALTGAALCGWSVVSLALYLEHQVLEGRAMRQPGDVIIFLSRAMDLRAGASPTLPVLFLASAVAFWGLIELWRVRHGQVALTEPDVHRLLQQAVYTEVTTMAASWEALNGSMLNVPRDGIFFVGFGLLAMCAFAFDPIRSLVSIEGADFGRFVSAALLLVEIMLMLVLVQAAFLWSRIRRLLGFMAHHHLADAYERVPRDVFPIMIVPRPPRLADLRIPVAYCAGRAGASSAAEAHSIGMQGETSDLEKIFRLEMRASPNKPWAESHTWRVLLDGALQKDDALLTDRMLGSDARLRLTQMTASLPGDDFVARAIAEIVAADRVLHQREADLPAMLIAFVIRDALARLVPNLIFVVGGLILAFCSHTLFPFQQCLNLQVLAWIFIGVTFTTILTVLVQIKRNEIVARLTSIRPGRRTMWDSGFVLKVVVFALLPLLTLFAAQFPDVGDVLLRWIEPVQHVLP